MYNNCALIGGVICLADVFLLGADSQTDNPKRFVRLCQVSSNLTLFDEPRTVDGIHFLRLVERFVTGSGLFDLLRRFVGETCSNLFVVDEKSRGSSCFC